MNKKSVKCKHKKVIYKIKIINNHNIINISKSTILKIMEKMKLICLT